jgi:uncharacterized glyoxalase superfamily protein PhnB
MAPDPLEALRLPIVVVSPRQAFGAELRRRVERGLGRDAPEVPEEREDSEVAMAVGLTLLPSVTPVLHYDDPGAALRWIVDALGLTESWVSRALDGSVQHAELRWRSGFVSINYARGEYPASRGASVSLTVETDAEVDALYERAVDFGARIVRPVGESGYYFYSFGVQDPEGNRWEIGTDGRLQELREQHAGS